MSRRLRPKGVIVLATVVCLVGWIGIMPSAAATPSALAYDPATNTYTVLSTGADDTANLQAAFDGCGDTPDCVVQLGNGVFRTAQIVVRGFHGTFRGMGEVSTTVEALPNLPLGEFVTKPAGANNPWPVLFTFYDGAYVIRGLTFSEPWPEPLPAWEPCAGCGSFHALFAIISVTGLHADVVVDHITMVGASGDWTFGSPVAYNVINGIFPQALVLGKGKPDFSRVLPFQVDFELTNSQFYMIDNPSGGENLEDSTYTARFNTLDNMEYGFWFVDVGNSVMDVSHNVFRNVIFGSAVIAYQNRPINVWLPCQPHSDIWVTHNDFQFTEIADGVILVDYADRFGCEKSLDAVVLNNRFRGDATSYEAVLLYMMASVVVSGNVITGVTRSEVGSVTVLYGAATVTGNDILGARWGVLLLGAAGALIQHNEVQDSLEFGIMVFGSSGTQVVQNEILGSGYLDILWDMAGFGNTFVKNECRTSDPAGLCGPG